MTDVERAELPMPDGSLMYGEAVFSDDHAYRYQLTRTWDTILPTICWDMLNPSKASAMINDPTLLRVVKFSQRWGYGRCILINAFAYCASDPRELRTADDPIGPDWVNWFYAALDASSTVMAAWGNNVPTRYGAHIYRMKRILWHYPNIYCLGRTKSGEPIHPLARGKCRVPDERLPVRFP
jgi:hypothetical protein